MASKFNGSGCKDSTAHEAINNIDKKTRDVSDKARKIIKMTKELLDFAGFDVIGRIVIKDKETGREFK